jgi:hypothetical protein
MKQFPFLVCMVFLLLLVPGGLAVTDTDPPYITSASPSSVSNTFTGSTTITIYGSGFQPGIQAAIYPCFTTPTYGSVNYVSSTQLTVTMSFYGQTTVNWHIRLKNPDGDVSGVQPFSVIGPSDTTTTTATTSTIPTTTTTTATASTTQSGKNSVYFETNPSGATIYIDGDNVGTSPFTYRTDRDGTYMVVARMSGFADYEDRVTILEGQRVRFYGKLTPLSSTTGAVTTAPSATGSSSTEPVCEVTTIRKSTLKIPTPLGTDPPLTAEESPMDPAIALWAAGIGIMFVVLRRR